MKYSKLFTTGLAMAALLGGLTAAQADYRLNDPTMGKVMGIDYPVGNIAADMTLTPGRSLVMHVVNPTSQVLLFSIPELGVSYFIPANSEQNIAVDVSPISRESLAYQFNTPDGTLLSSGTVQNEGSAQVALDTFTSSSYTAAVTPSGLITTQNLEKEEPVYTTPSRGAAAVRGFW